MGLVPTLESTINDLQRADHAVIHTKGGGKIIGAGVLHMAAAFLLEQQKEIEALKAAQQPAGSDVARDAELWASIDGFDGSYEISSIGRVRSLDRVDSDNNFRKGRIMNASPTIKGYMRVSLTKGGIKKDFYVHRLVADAFIPNLKGHPQVNHKDGDVANNAVSNLEWVTNAENLLHARRQLCIGVRPIYGISVTDGSRIDFPSLQLAVEQGFVRANIQKCIAGTRKKHKGYTWHDAAIDAACQREGE